MKHRNIFGVLALSIVTLGLYVIYWLYKTRLELLAYSPDKKAIPKVVVLFLPIITLLSTALLMFMSVLIPSLSPSISILVIILGMLSVLGLFVVSLWWFYRYAKTVSIVTNENGVGMLYGLWVATFLLGVVPIWLMIVQEDLNKFIAKGSGGPSQPHPQYPAAQSYQQPPVNQYPVDHNQYHLPSQQPQTYNQPHQQYYASQDPQQYPNNPPQYPQQYNLT